MGNALEGRQGVDITRLQCHVAARAQWHSTQRAYMEWPACLLLCEGWVCIPVEGCCPPQSTAAAPRRLPPPPLHVLPPSTP